MKKFNFNHLGYWFLLLVVLGFAGFYTTYFTKLFDPIQEEEPSDVDSPFQSTRALAKKMLKSAPDSAIILLENIVPELRNLAEQTSHSDILLEVLSDLGNAQLEQRELESALANFREVYQGVAGQEDQEKISVASRNLGRVLIYLGQLDSAKHYLNQALWIEEEFNNPALKGQILSDLGAAAGRNRQSEEALSYYEQALAIYLADNNEQKAAHSYFQIGATHYLASDLPLALESLLRGYPLAKKSGNISIRDYTVDLLVDIFYSLGDLEKATVYVEEQIAYWLEQHGPERHPILAQFEGELAFTQGEYPAAILLLRESLSINPDQQFRDFVGYYFLGQAYQEVKKLDSAMLHLETALQLSDRQPIVQPRAQCLLAIGKVQRAQNDLKKATTTYEEAFSLAHQANLMEQKMQAAAALYELYKKKGNKDLALQYFEESAFIRDSLFDAKIVAEVTRLNAQHEFDQEKQALVFKQEQENSRQESIKRLLWIGLAFLGILLGIGTFYYRAKQKSNTRLHSLNKELFSQKTVIEEQKNKLEELDQLKSRFFTNISHEFRTPLTIIKGMIEQVRKKPNIHLEKGAEMIRHNTVNLLNLVNQILDLRKLESNELSLNLYQGDVIHYLQFIIESYSTHAEQHGLKLYFKSDLAELTMDYDSDKLLRIVSNLLTNAVKFTPENGEIYFRVSKQEAKLKIQVEDSGLGIAQKNLPYVFDRFYQEDNSPSRSGEGTGIGLTLTKELVQLLGGNIEVSSQLGEGSIFTVMLPITHTADPNSEQQQQQNLIEFAQQKNRAAASLSMPSTVPEEEKAKLLIVEDNQDLREYLVAALGDYYSLDVAENGAAGIDKAIAHIPDLIISDVMMPEKDGYELTHVLKEDERTDHIPIILLTARSDMDSKISGLQKGADAYLAKPVEERELLVRIEKLLELRKKLQERYATPSSPNDEAPSIEDPFLQKLYDIVEKNIADSTLNMEQISQDIGMSRTQVFRKLKALTGKSATSFIRSIRLQKGKKLLQTTDLSISDIAYDVGFTSLSYFSTAFMEEFGKRPSSLRK